MSSLLKWFAKFMPDMFEAGMRSFLNDIRQRASRGEIDPAWLLSFATTLRAVADELEAIAGGDTFMAKVRRKAKRVEIEEEDEGHT